MQPRRQKSKGPVQYHCYDSCNKCGGVNKVEITDTLEAHMLECKTTCKECGFNDYWAHGFFESCQEIESKCNKYSFGES